MPPLAADRADWYVCWGRAGQQCVWEYNTVWVQYRKTSVCEYDTVWVQHGKKVCKYSTIGAVQDSEVQYDRHYLNGTPLWLCVAVWV
jgi:hypothetical protein